MSDPSDSTVRSATPSRSTTEAGIRREWALAYQRRKAALSSDEVRKSLELAEEAIAVDPNHRLNRLDLSDAIVDLVFWETADGAVRLGLGPGELHRLWVVDVEGTIVVVDATTFSGTSAADRAELQAIIDSITP